MSVYISHDGYCSTNQAEAREHGSFETYDTPATKADWVKFLNENYFGAPEPDSSEEINPVTGNPVSEAECKRRIEAAVRNAQTDHNITAEEQIQNGSFDDACRLLEQCTGRINEHIRAVKRGETL